MALSRRAAGSAKAEEAAALVDHKARNPGKRGHVGEQEQGPAQASRLALDHGQGAHALARQGEEYHERQAG